MRSTSPRYITAYYETLRAFTQHGATQEGAVRFAFQTLLTEAAKPRGLTVLGEQTIQLTNRRLIRLDGEVKDQYKLRVGVWEAKDTSDHLEIEIRKKIASGYPTKNIVFENTQWGVLYQNGSKALTVDLTKPDQLLVLLNRFLDYSAPHIEEFHRAVATFRTEIPELARGLTEIIETEKHNNRRFSKALDIFLALCRKSLNPQTSLSDVEDMLKQHLLTERIFRSVFNNPDFVNRNTIAREIETVIAALTSRSFSRAAFTNRLDYIYRPIELAASTIQDYSEKQSFLNTVYEQFFQAYATNTADTHGIVYTPAPIVKWMVSSVEEVLQQEFGLSLSDEGVHILDPATGTGGYMLEIIDRIDSSILEHKYKYELHCNEILLLPYYIAAQNIEHEYFERTGIYEEFPGICFADTLDMLEDQQLELFSEENTERIQQQKESPITVIIGNPPYNVGQVNENDNNKNRKYPVVDKRIRETYSKDSKATNKNALSDAYVKFFRWAVDRLGDRDGIICFVSNNGFLDGIAFDGFRKHFAYDFTTIYHFDLGGNVRRGGGGNVFDIRVGVGITLAVHNSRSQDHKLYYSRIPESWTRDEKLALLENVGNIFGVGWQALQPDIQQTWLTEGIQEDFARFLALGSKEAKSGKGNTRAIFKSYSRGIATCRDRWVYNFDSIALTRNVRDFIKVYDNEIFRWKKQNNTMNIDNFVMYDDTKIKWSRDLKLDLLRGNSATFESKKIRKALYRPFCKQFLFLDRILNEEVYQQPCYFPTPDTQEENVLIWLKVGSDWPMFALMTNTIPDLLPQGGSQCFPFYVYNEDGTNRRENITDWALTQYQTQYSQNVTKWEIFYYIYALLHHPAYCEHYKENLKRELPRIPFVRAEIFSDFVAAGKELAALHVGYENAKEHQLRHIEDRSVPFTWRVEQMRLSKDKTQIRINEALTLDGIPPDVFAYRLGNRSALEWVIDQYQLTVDPRSGIVNDPNNDDDPKYIVRLVKKIVTISIETIQIIATLEAAPVFC